MFGGVRAAIVRAFNGSEDEAARRVRNELTQETASIEQFLQGDSERLTRLFQALDVNDQVLAEGCAIELVTGGRKALAG